MLTVGDLFSGIGGFSLGLEATGGFKTIWFAETDAYASAVLSARWPTAPNFGDIRAITAATLANTNCQRPEPTAQRQVETLPRPRLSDSSIPNVLCGGFPCQDISYAGLGGGIDGAQSGLWAEYARLICEIRPRWAIMENVAALLTRGLDRVLGDLATLGYDAEWYCIPASAVGAPHQRDRIWIVAYPAQLYSDVSEHHRGSSQVDGHRHNRENGGECKEKTPSQSRDGSSNEPRLEQRLGAILHQIAYANESAPKRVAKPWKERGPWSVEPAVGRVANGIPSRVDRLRCLGNAIVPQIAQIIGAAILDYETSVTEGKG